MTKMTKLDISAVILTYNEEIHIQRCLERICPVVKDVFIVDCFSVDRTLDIVADYQKISNEKWSCGISVLQNEWVNHAIQFNWALENAPIRTEWVLRLDADEYLCPELIEELYSKLPNEPESVAGISFLRRRVWMGRTIRRGLPPIRLTRLFRFGKARSEVRQMDEHIELLEGIEADYDGEFADDNLNNISVWTQKHVGYAIREAVDLLDIEYNLTGAGKDDESRCITPDAKAKRMMKHKYAKSPLFLRSFAYFCYRYFFRFGFLEGKEGFMWHFFQGWWYRSLVDAKVYEIKAACGLLNKNAEKMKEHEKLAAQKIIKEHLKLCYNIVVD